MRRDPASERACTGTCKRVCVGPASERVCMRGDPASEQACAGTLQARVWGLQARVRGDPASEWWVSRTEVVTPEVPDHVTVGRSCDQTGSKSSRDPSRDQAPKKALTLSDKESEDKEREHAWMHAYFCRRNLCYVHDRY